MSMPAPTTPPKTSKLPWIIVGCLALLLIAGAVVGLVAINRPAPVAARAASTPVEEHLAEEPELGVDPSTEASASAAPTAGVLKLGEKRRLTVDGFTLEVAALKVKHGAGYEGVQVRTCNRGPEVDVSSGPWSLGYDNFEQLHDIDIIGGGLPAPAYEGRTLGSGDCTKGWLNYERISGQRPDGIQYAPDGAEPVRWKLG